MKKGIFLTTLSFVLVIVVLGFGIYSAIVPSKKITSDVIFNVSDPTVNVTVEGEAGWVDASHSGKTFVSQSQTDGFSNKNWALPDVAFTESNVADAVMKLTLTNNSSKAASIDISGVAYDPEHRFEAHVHIVDYQTGNDIQEIKVESDTQIISYNIPGKTTEQNVVDPNAKIIVKVTFSLLKTNEDFEIDQNMLVTFTTFDDEN